MLYKYRVAKICAAESDTKKKKGGIKRLLKFKKKNEGAPDALEFEEDEETPTHEHNVRKKEEKEKEKEKEKEREKEKEKKKEKEKERKKKQEKEKREYGEICYDSDYDPELQQMLLLPTLLPSSLTSVTSNRSAVSQKKKNRKDGLSRKI